MTTITTIKQLIQVQIKCSLVECHKCFWFYCSRDLSADQLPEGGQRKSGNVLQSVFIVRRALPVRSRAISGYAARHGDGCRATPQRH